MRRQALEKNLEFRFEIDPQLPEQITGDRIRIQQILANLLGNAFKFTDSGSVVLCATVQNYTDEFISLIWEVVDTGAGIPKDKCQHIFNSFEQVDNSDTRKYIGTGLGLAISRQLARLMGGDITVVSQEGVGSTFRCSMKLGFVDAGNPENLKSYVVNAPVLTHDGHI